MWLFLQHMYFSIITRIMTDNTISGHSFPGGASGKDCACQCRRWKRHRFDPWIGRSPGEGHGNPIQYFCLQNSMDRRAYRKFHGAEKMEGRYSGVDVNQSLVRGI